MLDDLLGRTELKERIAELEDEVERLEARYEAESDRRADAVRARQEAEERVNRLEDRIADLEGRLAATDDAAAENDVSPRGRETLSGARLREVLSRLRSVETDAEGALTAAVDADRLPEAVVDAVGDRAPLVRHAAPCLVCTDDAGLVAVTLSPPCLPDPFASWDERFRLDDAWFHPRPGDVLALVRSDLFVAGRYADDAGDGERGGRWSVVETVESDVKSAHSKGGFSQGRFERRREAQIDDHVDRALDALDALEAVDAADRGRLLVVGERTVLGPFEARADAVARVDASGDPEAAFETAIEAFFTTRLSLL
jgi:peptide subunit release factor 1 (eRF1)